MADRLVIPMICTLFLVQSGLHAQQPDSVFYLSAIVYNEAYLPVLATHVINMNTYKGDVTDSLGIFTLPVQQGDTLLFRNIAFRDTLVPVIKIQERGHIRLRSMRYELQEARVFEWGATYDDFREAFINMPVQQTLGSSLGLPRQDPDKVPMEMNERAVKSLGLLLTQPISFFYYNFSSYAKSARKVYWLTRNQEKQDQFEALLSAENLSDISGLGGGELEAFQLFLSQRMQCDLNCSELEIYSEVYSLWELYQELLERGMIEEKP